MNCCSGESAARIKMLRWGPFRKHEKKEVFMAPGLGLLLTGQETALALAQMFRDAWRAHNRAFLASNGEDAEWPVWHA